MKLARIDRAIRMSAMPRTFALVAALVLASACLADVAHAAAEAGGCPQVKLEGQRSPASAVDSAVVPDRFAPREPTMVGRVAFPASSLTPPPVIARRAAPRAPPLA
jgi:hypothetical protein